MKRETKEAKALRLLFSTPVGLSSAELQRRTWSSKRFSSWDIRKLTEKFHVRAMLHTSIGEGNRLRYRLEAFGPQTTEEHKVTPNRANLRDRQLATLALAKAEGGADCHALARALGRSNYVSEWTLRKVIRAHMPGGLEPQRDVDYGVFQKEHGERNQRYWVAPHVGRPPRSKKPMAKEYGVDTERKVTALGLVAEAVVAGARRRCNERQPCGAEAREPGAKNKHLRCIGCPFDDVDALADLMATEVG